MISARKRLRTARGPGLVAGAALPPVPQGAENSGWLHDAPRVCPRPVQGAARPNGTNWEPVLPAHDQCTEALLRRAGTRSGLIAGAALPQVSRGNRGWLHDVPRVCPRPVQGAARPNGAGWEKAEKTRARTKNGC